MNFAYLINFYFLKILKYSLIVFALEYKMTKSIINYTFF